MRTYNNEIKYGDFVEDNKEEILKSAVNAINPDFIGMTRDQALTLAGAMKNCGFSRGDFADVMGRSAQNKGTFEKQWSKIRGEGKRGEATEATIFQYALQSGWKWPAPTEKPVKRKPKAARPKMISKAGDNFNIVCLLDKESYTEKPPKNAIWEIRKREEISGPMPKPISIKDFAQAITKGQTFYPVVYSKDLEGYTAENKPQYKYRAIEQQIFIVDIDNEAAPGDPIENPLSIDGAMEICEAHNIKPFFVYETFSSKKHREDPEKPYQKFRLCFAMDKPLLAQDFGERGLLSIREWFVNLFGAAADQKTMDNARPFFGTNEKDHAHLFNYSICSDFFIKQMEERPESEDITADKTPEELPDLITVDAGDLLAEDIPPIKFVVNEIAPEGFGILAAKPKYKKSFLALQICIAVVKGGKVLGQSTTKAKCLYFDLESSHRRPQARLLAKNVNVEDVKGRLIFVTSDDLKKYQKSRGLKEPLTLANGFDVVLDNYLAKNRDIGLVIIDVLQKIRTEQKKNQQLYAYDYADIDKLTEIAKKYNVCIMGVHHATKMNDEADPYNNASGSIGMFAAVDFAWIITKEKRNSIDATLHIDGKDLNSQELTITFNDKTLDWEYKGTVEDVQEQRELEAYNQSNIVATIVKLVNTNNGSWEGTATDIKNAGKYFQTPIYDTPQKVGTEIDKFSDMLAWMDNISIYRERGTRKEGRSRKLTFKKIK